MNRPKRRSCIDQIKPYEPGKPVEEVERELGLKGVLKMASNENPLGPSPAALKALKGILGGCTITPMVTATISRRPWPGSSVLRRQR